MAWTAWVIIGIVILPKTIRAKKRRWAYWAFSGAWMVFGAAKLLASL